MAGLVSLASAAYVNTDPAFADSLLYAFTALAGLLNGTTAAWLVYRFQLLRSTLKRTAPRNATGGVVVSAKVQDFERRAMVMQRYQVCHAIVVPGGAAVVIATQAFAPQVAPLHWIVAAVLYLLAPTLSLVTLVYLGAVQIPTQASLSSPASIRQQRSSESDPHETSSAAFMSNSGEMMSAQPQKPGSFTA